MDTFGSQSLTLHLGVVDVPYAFDAPIKGFKSNKNLKGMATKSITTYDVAKILEEKYEIMQTFYDTHEDKIGGYIEESLQGAMESLLMNRAVDPWGAATQEIDRDFRDWISSYEAEKSIHGAPTLAAVAGVNHRLAHPYARGNPRRPSFRDTGLFVNSFRSSID